MNKKILAIVVALFLIAGILVYVWHKQGTRQSIAKSNMITYRLNKMWRDGAAAKLEETDGAIIARYILNDDEYRKELQLKLLEEAQEVVDAKDNKDLISEIGDVYEVLDCIIAFYKLDKDEIYAKQTAKRQDRGSYLAREFITTAQVVPGSFLHNYYLQSPERHQPINE